MCLPLLVDKRHDLVRVVICLVRITISWNVELGPETAAVVRHRLGVAVELAHGEGVVGHQVVAGREAVHALGGVGGRHPLHLIYLDGHAGGFVGGQTGPVLVRSGYGAEMRKISNILRETSRSRTRDRVR